MDAQVADCVCERGCQQKGRQGSASLSAQATGRSATAAARSKRPEITSVKSVILTLVTNNESSSHVSNQKACRYLC